MQQKGSDPRSEPHSMQNLLLACENAKRNLSQRASTRFAINHAGHTLAVDLTRQKFEELCADLLYRTERRLARVLDDAGLRWNQIDQVLTVGGSTRMPQVQTMLQRVTGRPANQSLAPDEVVAHGAAIHAAIRLVQMTASSSPPVKPDPPSGDSSTEAMVLLDEDVPPPATQPPAPPAPGAGELPVLEFDDSDDDDLPIVLDDNAAVSSLRAAATRPGATQESSDDIVAADDALEVVEEPSQGTQGDNDLTGVLQAIHTINVNAHSLGVVMKASDGKQLNSILIPRNTPLPTSVTRRYGTVVDNQTAVTVRVVEGESSSADDCITIGKCQIRPLPWGLRKGSTIYVTFSYDNSGRLHVKAVEATTGSQAATLIERQAVLDPQHIEEARQTVEQTTVS
jgi:molecular chaperone DnaK (HSP70)